MIRDFFVDILGFMGEDLDLCIGFLFGFLLCICSCSLVECILDLIFGKKALKRRVEVLEKCILSNSSEVSSESTEQESK